MKGTKAIPLPPNSQQEGEQYNEKQIEGQTEAQTKLAIEINKDLEERYERKRRYNAEEEEEDISRETFEKNAREAEEYNSQRELDDLEESEPYNDEDNHLEDDEFTGNYFEKPDAESEQKESLGNRIRAKYDSFKASASNAAENVSSSFGESFGSAAGVASAKYSRFKKGDPIFSVQAPVRRGKTYTRSVSRPGRSISRPYSGGRFGGDEFSLGTTANNLYYPVPVNDGRRQSFSSDEPGDLYLPTGTNPYTGEFSGRKAFKREFSDERESYYDPFGYGGLSGDGFDNTSPFGSSLMSFGGDNNGIFGGMSAGGTDTVLGNGAMFNAPRGKSKREANGFGLDLIIGDSGGMYNTSDPSPRKTTTQRKKASKIKPKTKKVSKAKPTKRKSASTRKTAYSGFALP